MSQKPASNMTSEDFAAWRKSHDFTQAEAAQRLGVSKRSVYGYENSAPIPESIRMSCLWITHEEERLDAQRLVREQYPGLGNSVYLVLPFQIERAPTYGDVLEVNLKDEVAEWLSEHAPKASLSIKTILTEAGRRLQIPIIIFEGDHEAFYFKMRWC